MRDRLGSFLYHRPWRVLAGVVVALVGMLLFTSVSLGAQQRTRPIFGHIENKEIFSTRALIVIHLETGYLATKWTAYYRTGSTGPWTEVNSEEVAEPTVSGSDGAYVEIGAPDNEEGSDHDGRAVFLRGLKPGTSYEARFVAENTDGTAEEVIPFQTLPVEKPEIDANYGEGGIRNPTTFAGNNAVLLTDTSSGFIAKIDANGAAATYAFEYASSENGPWKEFTSGGAGTIGASEEYKWVQAGLSGLEPETKYYVRVKASNEKGETVQSTHYVNSIEFPNFFITKTAKPRISGPAVRNVTANSVFLRESQGFSPDGSETQWRFEYAESESGPWSVVPGGSGTISQAQAEATSYDSSTPGTYGVRLSGLSASTRYYLRASASNVCAKGCGSVTSEAVSFTTAGAPSAGTDAAHDLNGESLVVLGSVDPNSEPTSDEQVITLEGAPTGGSFTLSFNSHSTASLPYNASAEAVRQALEGLTGGPKVAVEGPDGGPYTVGFYGESGGNSGVSEPQIEGSGLELSPVGGAVSVVTTQPGGVAYVAHYHFEYVSEKSFAEHGWEDATQAPEEEAGSGTGVEYVSSDLPAGLTAGETYRFRLVAQSNAPGTGPVEGSEQSLTVPVPAAVTQESCGNEAFRTGVAARLPDCRAYEQLTPVEKEGAQEPFVYESTILNAALVGEDGEHVVLEAEGTDYRKGPSAGQYPYLFSREASDWSMLAGNPQPEAGVRRDIPQAYNSDLTQVAVDSEYGTSAVGVSPDVEYDVGPLGGPYKTVVSIPRKYNEEGELEGQGWVGADGDFSKLVLMTTDHELLGEEETGTKSGSDLYEYTPSGGLAQLNVSGEPAVTIGSCGAKLVKGYEDSVEKVLGESSPHSVSADGSRVFFEAVPGGKCHEEAPSLYMRVDGSETVDIGAYHFLAANAQGTSVLLESHAGGEFVLYDAESHAVTVLPGLNGVKLWGTSLIPTVSAGLNALYFKGSGGLYKYDIPAEKLEFVVPADSGLYNQLLEVTPDGRYAYFEAESVAGLPGGSANHDGLIDLEALTQVYRYDSQERVVECVSCASPYDPSPKLPALLGSRIISDAQVGPLQRSVSGNGDYAFFTTPAALVREDDDGEIPIEGSGQAQEKGSEFGTAQEGTSPSSDIYEWRADGVHGCGRLDGCVALLSGGHGGYMTLFLGSADEGEDVYFYTREKLVSQDQDTSGDIYDVRVGGGFPSPPPRPTECEADACSTPPSCSQRRDAVEPDVLRQRQRHRRTV